MNSINILNKKICLMTFRFMSCYWKYWCESNKLEKKSVKFDVTVVGLQMVQCFT